MSTVTTAPPAPRLHVSERIEDRRRRGELTPKQVEDFRRFLADVDRDLLRHRVITLWIPVYGRDRPDHAAGHTICPTLYLGTLPGCRG